MDIVIQYFFTAFTNSINLLFFFVLMFVCELIKMLPFIHQDVLKNKYFIKFPGGKLFYFNFKWVVLLCGVLLGIIFFFIESYGLALNLCGFIILKLVLTFSITLTLYDYLFQLIIVKSKQILVSLIKAKIQPINIDLNNSINNDASLTGSASTDQIEEVKTDGDNSTQ